MWYFFLYIHKIGLCLTKPPSINMYFTSPYPIQRRVLLYSFFAVNFLIQISIYETSNACLLYWWNFNLSVPYWKHIRDGKARDPFVQPSCTRIVWRFFNLLLFIYNT